MSDSINSNSTPDDSQAPAPKPLIDPSIVLPPGVDPAKVVARRNELIKLGTHSARALQLAIDTEANQVQLGAPKNQN